MNCCMEVKRCATESSGKNVQRGAREGFALRVHRFAGEQHGFRRAKNIKRVLEAELYFCSRVFDFPLAGAIELIAIENSR